MQTNADQPLSPDEQLAYIRSELGLNQFLTNDDGTPVVDGSGDPVESDLWTSVDTKWRLHAGKGDTVPYLRMLYTLRDTIIRLRRDARLFVDNKIGNDSVSANQVFKNIDSLLNDTQLQIIEIEGPQSADAGIMGSVSPVARGYGRESFYGGGGRNFYGSGGKGRSW